MTHEQSDLLQKADASLRAAQVLNDQGFYDFAASRAYYAMFYVAQALLLKDDISHSKHSAVIAAFGQRFAKTGRIPAKFHRYLIEGQDSRNVADYDARSALTKSAAQKQILRAREFITTATEFLSQPKNQGPA